MNYKVIEAVWLATAVMTYEKIKAGNVTSIEDLAFKQADIQKRASQFTTDNVDNARISQWCNADHVNHSHKFLRDVNGKRRLVFQGEFNDHKVRPNLKGTDVIMISDGNELTIEQLIDFHEQEYTTLFTIDFMMILNHLDKYANAEYIKPEKVQNDNSKYTLYQTIKESGTLAVNELDRFANVVASNYDLLNKSNTSFHIAKRESIVRPYLWNQLVIKEFKDYPTSMSIFAEKQNDIVRFRLAIELDEKKANSEDFHRHHQFLNLPINLDPTKYFYYVTTKEKINMDIYDQSAKQIKVKVETGEFKRVQLCYALTKEEIINNGWQSNEVFQDLIEATGHLLPYYNKAMMESEKGGGGNTMFAKNNILYGPPGTGKTYNTVNYAVSIIENKSIDEILEEDYKDVFERYITYKKQGQVGFITFHQSYGYEEFIEGIKPALDEDTKEGITYKIESGVFKEFCDNAQQLKLTTNNEEIEGEKNVWKISLGGSGMNLLKEECFANNQIRIGWDSLGLNFLDEEEYPSDTLYYFYEEMSIGDIVFSLADQKHIDAIGIITGEPRWLETEENYKRSREVKWIATDIYENIYELNGKKNLVQQTIYKLSRLSINDVNNLILKYSQNNEVDVKINNNNYVFIIDEINRGNISKIFGELITLIEPTKRIGANEGLKVKLPYSKTEFGVPKNVYLLGTMNTADRSIALMDTALRRRFNFIEMMPDVEVLKGINIGSINIKDLVETMNRRIELLYDREHTIGHAYFLCLKDSPTIEKLAGIFQNAIIPLLQEYFYEDYSKIQLVLGDNAKKDEYKFILDEKIKRNAVFKGNPDMDLPEQKYHIQTAAFSKEESYKGIYE